MNCVEAALKYANDPRNDGNGYSIKVEMETGRVIEGVVAADDMQQGDILVIVDPRGEERSSEVFIDKRRVIAATIIW